VRTGRTSELVRLDQVVGADRHQAAVADFDLTKELHQALVLAAIFWTESPATEDDDHWIAI
jgi:hypothetical protein